MNYHRSHHQGHSNHQRTTHGTVYNTDEAYDSDCSIFPTPLDPARVVIVDIVSLHESFGGDDATLRAFQTIFFRGEGEHQRRKQDGDSRSVHIEGAGLEEAVASIRSTLERGVYSRSGQPKAQPRYRALNSGQWFEKFQELEGYKMEFGDCLVPSKCSGRESLATWVKRQRYQYKLREEGNKSNLTDERIRALDELGFVWVSYGAKYRKTALKR
jgi:hypothetical protein